MLSCADLDDVWPRTVEEALGTRPFEALFSTSTGSAEFEATLDGELPGRESQKSFPNRGQLRALAQASADLRERANEKYDRSRHLDLLTSLHFVSGADWESAHAQLRDLAVATGGNAALYSDLAASYLVKAGRTSSLADLVMSVDFSTRAIASDGEYWRARFNRGLALSWLCVASAERDWSTLRESSLAPLLQREIEERLDRLRRCITQGSAGDLLKPSTAWGAISADRIQRLQRAFDSRLLGSWARLVLEGRAEDARELKRTLGEAASVVFARTGDRQPLEMVGLLDEGRAELAVSLKEHAEAMESYHRRDHKAATEGLASAIARLGRRAEPIQLWSRYYYTIAANWTARSDVREHLEELRAIAARRSYRRLEGYCSWMLGLVETEQNDLTHAVALYDEAIELLQRSGDRGAAAFVLGLRAEAQAALGTELAWASLAEAVPFVSAVRNLGRRATLWRRMSSLAQELGADHAALILEDEAVRVATLDGRWNVQSRALGSRAGVKARLGDGAGASEDLLEARSVLLGGTPGEGLERVEANQALVEGAVFAVLGEPAAEIESLGEAINYLRRSQGHEVLARALYGRARKLLSAGQARLAATDFEEASLILESLELEDSPVLERASYLEFTRGVFEEYVGVALEHLDDPALALRLFDRFRSLGLPEKQRWSGSVEDLASRLGQRDRMLGVFRRQGGLDVWHLSRDGLQSWRHEISASDVLDTVFSARASRRSSPNQESPIVSGHALVSKLLGNLPAAEKGQVTWVLHDPVAGPVPYSYLMRGTAIRVLRVGSSGRPRDGAERRTGSPVLLGDPRPSVFGDRLLPGLPESRMEVLTLGELYGVTPLVSAQATKEALLNGFENARVVHFGGHAVRSIADSGVSLVLAGTGSAIGAKELEGLDLRGLELAVLAGCDTLRGGDQNGLLSLGNLLAEGGARWVLASLWPILDGEHREVLLDVHRSFESNLISWPTPPPLGPSTIGLEWLAVSIAAGTATLGGG